MRVEVRAYSGLEKYLPHRRYGVPVEVEVAAGATVRDVLRKLAVPEKEVLTVLVDGKYRDLEYALNGGERVSLFPPVGGG